MTPEQRFEVLKTELALIQATLDKYDDLIFRGRNFFITLWIACVGLSFTIKAAAIPLLAVLLALLYWFLEGMMRHQYWFKYVDRYRFLRDTLNSPSFDLKSLSIYDLTNHFHRRPITKWEKFCQCFFKIEPSALYLLMGSAAALIWLLIHFRILELK